MPYQAKVSIGVKGHDTGRWMSPMKMFEYMAAGVPVISSDLAVLREILINEKNALLVSPPIPLNGAKHWIFSLMKQGYLNLLGHKHIWITFKNILGA